MLTDAQKMQVKRHLGYHSVSQSFYPLIEGFACIDTILSDLAATPATEAEVVVILGRLSAIETRLDAAPGHLAATVVDEITLRGPPELDALWTELKRWRRELSMLIGIPLRRGGASMVVT